MRALAFTAAAIGSDVLISIVFNYLAFSGYIPVEVKDCASQFAGVIVGCVFMLVYLGEP
jgi:hypothetical protein